MVTGDNKSPQGDTGLSESGDNHRVPFTLCGPESLSPEQKQMLYRFLEGQLEEEPGQPPRRRRVIEIEPVHLGTVLQPFSETDDARDEMLGGRG